MPKRRFVSTNGVNLMITEEGDGPLVVLLHGFPESAYSWRRQIRPLAEAGYRVVAPDQRHERPHEVNRLLLEFLGSLT